VECNSPIGCLIIEKETGEVVFANQTVRKIFALKGLEDIVDSITQRFSDMSWLVSRKELTDLVDKP